MSNGESKELIVGSDVPALADDFLIQVAEQAERRIDAVIKIKKVALKVTNASDWTDQQGKPYLQASGSEKVANLFNISWRIDEPIYTEESDGHFTWSYKGYFSLGGRSIEVEGTRSSKDPFFNKYDYSKPKDQAGNFPKLPPSTIDKGDIRKAALTNLLGNGITRILGIRNLTWNDLKEFAGINQDQVTKIIFKEKGETKPSIQQPQSKSSKTPEGTESTEGKKGTKESLIEELTIYVNEDPGKFQKVLKEITAFGDNKGTTDITKVSDKWAGSALGKLRERVKAETIEGCTSNPETCDKSVYSEMGRAYCGGLDQTGCKHQKFENA